MLNEYYETFGRKDKAFSNQKYTELVYNTEKKVTESIQMSIAQLNRQRLKTTKCRSICGMSIQCRATKNKREPSAT